jgi:hypothetical protein
VLVIASALAIARVRNDGKENVIMSRKIRIILGVLILVVSISLLVWGLAPLHRETRIQNISPSEMQLPTPSSFYWNEVQRVAFYPRVAL